MDILLEELALSLPDKQQLVRLLVRLFIAALSGAIIGIERERTGKEAGIRTHMLVALGAAMIVLGPLQSGLNSDELSRIIQGLVTGIGFIGGGAILKLQEKREIEGLTTAAGIWMTSAIGVAAGLGRAGLAIIGTILTWMILSVLGPISERLNKAASKNAPE